MLAARINRSGLIANAIVCLVIGRSLRESGRQAIANCKGMERESLSFCGKKWVPACQLHYAET